MARGRQGPSFGRTALSRISDYTKAIAPFIKFLPLLLMCLIVDQNDHQNEFDARQKLLIAHIVKELFHTGGKKGEWAYQSIFRNYFSTRKVRHWKTQFVKAFAKYTEATDVKEAEERQFELQMLICADITAGLHELMNGNPAEKKSKSLLCGWQSKPDDVGETRVPDKMAQEIHKVAIVVLEYLLHYQGAGDPTSQWCAMTRFFTLWTQDKQQIKDASYAPFVAAVMFLKNNVRNKIVGLVPACEFAPKPPAVEPAVQHEIASKFQLTAPRQAAVEPTSPGQGAQSNDRFESPRSKPELVGRERSTSASPLGPFAIEIDFDDFDTVGNVLDTDGIDKDTDGIDKDIVEIDKDTVKIVKETVEIDFDTVKIVFDIDDPIDMMLSPDAPIDMMPAVEPTSPVTLPDVPIAGPHTATVEV